MCFKMQPPTGDKLCPHGACICALRAETLSESSKQLRHMSYEIRLFNHAHAPVVGSGICRDQPLQKGAPQRSTTVKGQAGWLMHASRGMHN